VVAMHKEMFETNRKNMVKEQIENRGIKDPKILNAFLSVPRHMFVDINQIQISYEDFPLPIGQNQTISQPYIVALMTDKLDLDQTHKVLEIGTGSGYQTAILSCLSKEVHTIERIDALQIKARNILDRLKYKNITYYQQNGYEGLKDEAPFDRIMVTAAPKEVPKRLIEQMKDQGKMVIPIGDASFQGLFLIQKNGDQIQKELICYCRFVEMVQLL
jgi:protein-L-isoaspartate(D-aspartate) O-methyltransferase